MMKSKNSYFSLISIQWECDLKMASTFTVQKQNGVFILNSSANQIIFNEVFNGLGANKEITYITLKDSTGKEVNFNSVFSKFNVNVSNSADSTVFNADKVGAVTKIDVYDGTAQTRADGTTDTVTIDFDVLSSATEGSYILNVETVDNQETPASQGTQVINVKVVSVETALTDYENLVSDIATADLADIESKKTAVISAQQTAQTAISALDDGDTKTSLQTRFNKALDNQNQGLKELYLYYSKNNHLTLFKVNNVGGNVPFSIIFKDNVLVGSASEAFYYAPDSNVSVPVTGLTPTQKNIVFGADGTKSGQYLYIFKIGDKYYRTTIDCTVDSSTKAVNVTKVDSVEIPAGSVDNTGESYTVPGETVSKTALNDAISAANADYTAHVVGTEPGNVPENQRTTFKAAIDKAQAVYDNADAQADEVDSATKELNAAKTVFDGFIIKYYINEEALQTAVTKANDTVKAATVGENVGQTTQENIDTYKTAIAVAQKVLDDTPSNVDYSDKTAYDKYVKDVADAITALATATDAYNSNVVTNAKYAEAKVALYETAAEAFLNSIRKKIRI